MGQLEQGLDLLLVDALVPAVVLLLHLLDRYDLAYLTSTATVVSIKAMMGAESLPFCLLMALRTLP